MGDVMLFVVSKGKPNCQIYLAAFVLLTITAAALAACLLITYISYLKLKVNMFL